MFVDDVRTYLIAQGAAGTTAWPVYSGYLPDDQDQMIGLFDTGGLPADTLGRENLRGTFQVRVRAARLDYATAMTRWQLIFNALQDAQQMAGSPALLPKVIFIQAMNTSPLFFNDEKERPNLTVNFRTLVLA